jgi:hypothetical protein
MGLTGEGRLLQLQSQSKSSGFSVTINSMASISMPACHQKDLEWIYDAQDDPLILRR